MSRDTRKLGDDQDGVRVIETGARRRKPIAVLAVATLAAVASLYFLLEPGGQTERDVAMPPISDAGTRQPAQPRGKSAAAPVDEGAKANRWGSIPNRPADRARANPPEDAPAVHAEAVDDEPSQLEDLARGLIETLGVAGQGGGLAAFPPPGTNPVKTGVIVPETYELPAGYVRYHQVTDDGKRLEPILMFSPDYEFADSDGVPIALPEDGIVPADMVPPGLPVRMLEIPDAPEASDPGAR